MIETGDSPGRLASTARHVFRLRHPAQFIVVMYLIATAIGTTLLLMPWATQPGRDTNLMAALFTSTSSVTITGLTVVDTATHWTIFGQLVIMVLVQLGGLGIMTLAAMLGILVSHRLGLRQRLMAQSESNTLGLGDVRQVVRRVTVMTLAVEVVLAVVLGLRWWIGYDESPGRAAYLGVFHSISAFNNAGFALFPNNLESFVTDGWILAPIMLAVLLGGIGSPVVAELWRRQRARTWTVHTKITLLLTGALLVIGFVVFVLVEWSNPATLGPLSPAGKTLGAITMSVMPRSAGFNTVNYGDILSESKLATDVLMFIGTGSGGTGGGIKVTTFALLAFVILAEVRGDPEVSVFRRTLPTPVIRQALTVALLAVAMVMTGTAAIEVTGGFGLENALFESISAFATAGLSTGITPELPDSGQLVLVFLMFAGRLGTITLASSLALREIQRMYRYPDERPIIG